MNKIYGYDTNIYETSIGNIKCFNESCSKEDIEKAMNNKSFFEMALEEKDKTINQLQSNWNSLKEWVEEKVNNYKPENIFQDGILVAYKESLKKINELEGDNNEC